MSNPAQTATLSQTQSMLKRLDHKISTLQQTLNTAQNKQDILNQELATTEKKISIGVQELHLCQQHMDHKQQTITTLQQQINSLTADIHKQQTYLAKHLRARYTMGEYQPLQWLLNQDTPHTTSHLLTMYQYLVQSRLKTIDALESNTKTRHQAQKTLQEELAAEEQLQKKIHEQQQKLEQNKRYNQAIIQSLNQDIQSKQQTLLDYQKNKESLSALVKSLSQKSIVQRLIPFVSQRKKLPFPIAVNRNNLRPMNQGIIFFANEGTPVTTVSGGKVVFSDWLKGYGLLLIIDHGEGFMTLYAHNQSLFKQKGEAVTRGEQIATVGHSGGIKENGLYFEVRQRGKAVPPLQWLT